MPTPVNGAKVHEKPLTNHKVQLLNMENSINSSQETGSSGRFMLTANLSRNMDARNGALFKTLTSGKLISRRFRFYCISLFEGITVGDLMCFISQQRENHTSMI